MTVAPFRLRDLTDLSPPGYRVRPRRLAEIRAIVLHQTGFEWRFQNAMWARVRAHFVVHRCGSVSQLHPISARMRYGAGHANQWAINIECEGNYPLAYHGGEPVRWKPEKFGASVLDEAPAQVEAARALVAWLGGQVAGLQIGAHRQLDELKSGCCGPDLWREVGQYAIDVLGLGALPTNGGLDIPDEWRGPPRIHQLIELGEQAGPANLAPQETPCS